MDVQHISDFLSIIIRLCIAARHVKFSGFCSRPLLSAGSGVSAVTVRTYLPERQAFPLSVITGNPASGGDLRSGPQHTVPDHHPIPLIQAYPAPSRIRPPLHPPAVLFRFMVYIWKPENPARLLSGFFRWFAPARRGKMDRLSADVAV